MKMGANEIVEIDSPKGKVIVSTNAVGNVQIEVEQEKGWKVYWVGALKDGSLETVNRTARGGLEWTR